MEKNNFYIMLEKEWFYNGDQETLLHKYGSDGLIVYCIMLRNLTTRNTFSFSINSLCSMLMVNKKDNTKRVARIKSTIKDLNNELFTVFTDTNCNIEADINNIDNKNTYYCKRKNEALKEKFIMVYDDEIDGMIYYSSDKKNSISDLIAHYIFICNGFNNSKDNEGYLCYFGSLEYIESKVGIVQSTLISNNKIFIELNLLLIENVGGTVENNKYKNTSNIYARVENEKEFNAFSEIKRSNMNKRFDRKTDKEQQDKQRRLKQLINKYKKQNSIEDYMTKDDLTKKQFSQLYVLETNYLNFVLSREKVAINTHFLTIKKDGTVREQYEHQEIEEVFYSNEDDYD